jgi:hypothetical protein
VDVRSVTRCKCQPHDVTIASNQRGNTHGSRPRLVASASIAMTGLLTCMQGIEQAAFNLLFAFDEVISLGYKENVTVMQVKQVRGSTALMTCMPLYTFARLCSWRVRNVV